MSTLAVVLVLTWLGGISVLLNDFWTQTLTLIKAQPKDRLTLAGSWGKFITRPHSAFLVAESKLQDSYFLLDLGYPKDACCAFEYTPTDPGKA